jgi:hypothetical protein
VKQKGLERKLPWSASRLHLRITLEAQKPVRTAGTLRGTDPHISGNQAWHFTGKSRCCIMTADFLQ